MADEIESTVTPEQDRDALVDAFAELKQKSVPRATYDQLDGEYKKLLKAIVDGGDLPDAAAQQPKKSLDELRRELFVKDGDLNNLEFATRAMELHDRLIELGDPSPFLPQGVGVNPTQQEIENAEIAAEALRTLIERADGDPDVFQAEFIRMIPTDRGRR